MKRYLITGGAGFLGSNYIRNLLTGRADIGVTNLDALTYAGNLESLADLMDDPRYRFVKGDITDATVVEPLVAEADVVVHFAAESHVDRSILGPEAFVRSNIYGTYVLLEAARKKGTRFHHISTDEVFGALGPGDPKFTERTPYAPRSPYSASKAASDHLVLAYHHTYGLPVTITNCSNNYGPNQFPEKLIPLVITNLLEGKRVPVYGDGKQIRDWLFVEDHCRAIDLVLEKGRIGETYCVGGDSERENIAIVKELLALLGKGEESIEYVTDRPGHDRRYAVDTGKIREELGWQPSVTIEKGLAQTVRWYVEHEGWWKNTKSGVYQEYYRTQYGER